MRAVSRTRWRRLARMCACGAAVVLVAGVCPQQSGGVSPELVQTLNDLGDAIASLNQQTAEMQEQIDSLRAQVARQDTLVRRLADMTPLPSP